MKSKKKTRSIYWKLIGISCALLVFLSIIVIYILLYTYDLKNLKPHISRIVENATGRELAIGGDIRLQISLSPQIIVEDIALKNAQWGSSQNMIQAKQLKLQVALVPLLSKQIIVKRLVITEPNILLETDENGQSNFSFEKQTSSAVEEIKEKRDWPVFGSKKIIVENGQFTYNDLRNNETYSAKINRLTVMGKDLGEPITLTLRGLYNEQPISIEGTLGPLTALSDPAEKFQFDILIKADGNSMSLDGSIQDIASIHGIAFDFTSTINNPSIIEKLARQTFPIKAPFKISGNFTVSDPDMYEIPSFSFASQGIAFDGTIALNVKGKRPTIKAVIAASKLNLTSFMPDSPPSPMKHEPDEAEQKTSRVFSESPLGAKQFNTVDMDVQLSAASVQLPGVIFHNLSSTIRLTSGHLNIDNFKADMGTGKLDGYFHLYPSDTLWSVDTAMKIDQLPLHLLIPAKQVTDSCEGNIDMLFSLSGRGKSIAQLMASLDGDMGLSMCNGTIATKYIDLLGADFSTSLVNMLNPFQKKTDHTEVNCFVCILNINNGIAHTKVLVLDTGRTLTFGRGYADLTSEKLDISLKTVPKEGLGIDKIGKISISLSELSKPVKITGTLASPALTIDLTQTAITLSKVAGGVALLGPAGATLALVTGRIGDDNPCLAAVEAVKQGNKEEGLHYEEKEGIIKKTTTSITDRLKKLFGLFLKKPEKKSLA